MKIGVGTLDLPSPIGEYLGGFAKRTEPCKGVYDDLMVKTLALDDGERTCLIVSLDVVCLYPALADDIRQMISSSFGIEPVNVLLAASHTHSGPEIRTGSRRLPGFLSCTHNYVSQTKECILKSIEAALADLEECRLFYGVGQSRIGVNRRLPENGKNLFKPNHQGLIDESVPVIKVEGEDGKLKAVLFSYACHPSAMASDFATADYVGAAYGLVEETLGVPALFLQGFGANIKTDITEGTKFKVAEYDEMVELGESLGREVLRVLDSSIDEICPNLYTDSLQVSIPFSRMPGEEEIEAAQNSANQYLRRWAMGIKNEKSLPTSVDMEVQRFDLGTDLSILAISAEVVVEYGPLLKSIVPDMRIIPVGYANGVIGYVGVREHYKEGGYEVDGWYIHYLYPSPFALEVQDRIHDGVERLYSL